VQKIIAISKPNLLRTTAIVDDVTNILLDLNWLDKPTLAAAERGVQRENR
jgi:hypothetical protein